MMAIINTSSNNNSSSTKLSSSSSSSSQPILIPSSSSSTTSSMEDENVICPLCMENLDIDDRSFYPCTCGYQICRFCWHRIRSESDDQNGLCPACRKQYSENPATFKPLSSEDIQKLKVQKRQKDQQKKQKSESGKRHLADLRVVQKNLVFVVGISPRIADPDVLKKNEFFGKFGKIHKVVVNPCLQGTTASAYITYIKSDDALRAIQSVNNIPFDGKTIKVSLGTTKYCSHFMRNQTCPKTECMYLHHYGDPDASFTKEDMQAGKHQEYEKKLLEEFNTHQNNNNNNEGNAQDHQAKANGVSKEPKPASKKIANGSSIQQGVSYSTKLLVNNTPQQPPQPPQSTSPPQQKQPPSQPPQQPPTPPCTSSSSSSASSTSSTDHQLTAATTLLENTILSEEDDEDEREDEDDYRDALSSQRIEQPETTDSQESASDPVLDPFLDSDFNGGSNLDLDFDPFHETQKAFEEIINEQVGGESAEQNSLLRRFIKPVDEDPINRSHLNHQTQRDYLLGFHHTPQNHLPQPPPPQSNTPPGNTHYNNSSSQQTNSLLLDFFNNYAYKHHPAAPQTPPSIPPPPGFSAATPPQPQLQTLNQSNQSSSVLLEKLNRTLLGNERNGTNSTQQVHWGSELEEPPNHTPQRLATAADWMSLDPAIIFSKTSSERNNVERNNGNRNFIDNPLNGLFGDRMGGNLGGLGLHHHFGDRRGELYSQGQQAQNQQQSQVFGAQQHGLIRPTPTTTSPVSSNNYSYTNGLLPQQQFYQVPNPRIHYYSQQQQQQQPQQQPPPPQNSRYYTQQTSTVAPQSNQSVVTPPPPGFGGIHKQTQQYTNQVFALQQAQQMHNGTSGSSSAGYFPF